MLTHLLQRHFSSVRALAKIMFRAIAIPAKNLNPLRIPEHFHPTVEGISALTVERDSVLPSRTVDVIKR
jgi:hypothetical protein